MSVTTRNGSKKTIQDYRSRLVELVREICTYDQYRIRLVFTSKTKAPGSDMHLETVGTMTDPFLKLGFDEGCPCFLGGVREKDQHDEIALWLLCVVAISYQHGASYLAAILDVTGGRDVCPAKMQLRYEGDGWLDKTISRQERPEDNKSRHREEIASILLQKMFYDATTFTARMHAFFEISSVSRIYVTPDNLFEHAQGSVAEIAVNIDVY